MRLIHKLKMNTLNHLLYIIMIRIIYFMIHLQFVIDLRLSILFMVEAINIEK